jgi:drug/metabolite transporter (DMT)-like permease
MSVPLVSSLLALASAGCIGTSNFFGGLAARRTSAMSAVIWMELVGVLPALGMAEITTGTRSLTVVAYGMAIGVTAGAGLVCFYRALSVGAMGITAPLVGATSCGIPAVIGLTTGERLHVVQLVGLVVAGLAIVIIAFEGGGAGSTQSIVMAVIAGSLLGVNYFFTKAGSTGGAWTAVAARCSVAAFVAVAALASSTRIVPVRSTWLLVVLAGSFDTLGFVLLLFAYRGGMLSITTVLAALYPAITILLGWVVLRERLRATQIVGITMALVAVGLIGAG